VSRAYIATCTGHTKIPTVIEDQKGRLITAGADGTIREWEWNGGLPVKVLEAYNRKAVRGMVFFGEQLVTATIDGRIKLWNYSRSCVADELCIGDHAAIWTLQKLGEGSVVATIKAQDGSKSLKI
jgi:WD40 repeat protein